MKALFCPVLLAVSTVVLSAQDLSRLANADNAFAFDLFKQIASAEPGKNIFISPFSVSSALQMVANGAAGETKTEMDRVLKTGGLKPEDLNATCKGLMRSLNSETNAALTLANGIWVQKEFQLKPDFVAVNKNFFAAELANVDFKDSISASAINDWADTQTHGKIRNVVQFPFPPATRVVLANAIYFKGKWATPFDNGRTERESFQTANSQTNQVMMMSQQREFDYLENDNFQAVRLAYAGDRLCMYLFLPGPGSSPGKLAGDLAGDKWPDVTSRFASRKGLLEFPRFKLDYDVTLNEPLQALGIKKAFDAGTADFSAMANKPLFISQVKQKSFVAVDEEGTEAAAVTVVNMVAASMPMNLPPPFRMIVDRPFFFVIADRQTQVILFLGVVNDPAN